MHLICSYCGRYIKEKKPIEVTRITHGICLDCFVPASMLANGFSYFEYMETFDVPAVMMDLQQKILAANKAASAMLDKPIDRIPGMLGGEALECLYSKLPEGCGRTEHCQICTIRNLVKRTIKQGFSSHKELVSLETEEGNLDFLVSILFYNDLVLLVFEDGLKDPGELAVVPWATV